jgi:hypothetical protein
MLAFASFIFVYLIYEATEKYAGNQIVIKPSQKLHPMSDIHFPAVSVCPELLVRGNVFDVFNQIDRNSKESVCVGVVFV